MPASPLHIPFLETIADFFEAYGIGTPLHPDIMCIRLEDQPDTKLTHVPLLYRINFFRIIHLYESALDFTQGEAAVPTPHSYIRFSVPGKLESWSLKGRLYGYVIYFAPAFAGFDVAHPHFDEMYPYFSQQSQPVLSLSQVDAQALKILSDEMIEETYSDRPDKWVMVHKLLHVYFAKVRRLYIGQLNEPRPSPTLTGVNQTLFNRFRAELDTYFQELAIQKTSYMPSVSVIAQRLNVNPNYLNSTIKKITGRTASSYIQDKIMLEAKAYLLHSDIQIAEIAYNLGFEHVSYFNRFFKKHARCAPVEFRRLPRRLTYL